MKYSPGSKRDLISKLRSYGWAFSTNDLDQQGRRGQRREREKGKKGGRVGGRDRGREEGRRERREIVN